MASCSVMSAGSEGVLSSSGGKELVDAADKLKASSRQPTKCRMSCSSLWVPCHDTLVASGCLSMAVNNHKGSRDSCEKALFTWSSDSSEGGL